MNSSPSIGSGLSLDELAVLEFTNDHEFRSDMFGPVLKRAWRRESIIARKQGILLTTKSSYLWAVLIAAYVESHKVHDNEGRRLMDVLYRVAERWKPETPNLYRLDSGSDDEMRWLESTGMLLLLDKSFSAHTLKERAEKASQSLIAKSLIEDPIELVFGGVAVAAIGLVPIMWTRKTKNGQLVSEKMNALFWKYESSSDDAGVETKTIEFQLFRMLKAFQFGAAGAFMSVIGEESVRTQRQKPSKRKDLHR
jgi:hypothetical protein